MKSIFYWMMLIPFLVFSQGQQTNNEEYLIVGSAIYSAKSDKMEEFSEGMKTTTSNITLKVLWVCEFSLL